MKTDLKAYKKNGKVYVEECKQGGKIMIAPGYCKTKRGVIAWIISRGLDRVYNLDNIDFGWDSYSRDEHCKTIGERNRIAIMSVDKDGKEIKRFSCFAEASKYYGISTTSISRCLRGHKTRRGIIFKRVE